MRKKEVKSREQMFEEFIKGIRERDREEKQKGGKVESKR